MLQYYRPIECAAQNLRSMTTSKIKQVNKVLSGSCDPSGSAELIYASVAPNILSCTPRLMESCGVPVYVSAILWLPDVCYTCLHFFYRAMHFSAKRGIAIACRLSVRLSVCDVGEL